MLQEGKRLRNEALDEFETAKMNYNKANELINEAVNGLVTYAMAKMSAEKYKESNMSSSVSILKGDTMRYQNKTIFRTPGATTWYTRYRDVNGQHYISGKTQREVYDKLKIALANKATVKKKEKVIPITLKIWIEKWYKLYKSELRERSIIELHAITDKFPTSMLKKNIKNFTAFELNEYVNSSPGARTRQRRFTVLNDLFDKAYKNDLIVKNPMITLKKPKYEAPERDTLSIEEENKLLAKVTTAENYIYALGILQGLRPGELFALEYRDVDFNKMTISITKSIDEVSADKNVKNKYSYRTIPLFKKTYEIIKDIDTSSGQRFAKHSVNVTNDKLKELLADITSKRITLYNLRHTFITRMQDSNIPEHLIQAWVGHGKDSKITKKVYTHVTSETELKYINILNQN